MQLATAFFQLCLGLRHQVLDHLAHFSDFSPASLIQHQSCLDPVRAAGRATAASAVNTNGVTREMPTPAAKPFNLSLELNGFAIFYLFDDDLRGIYTNAHNEA
jgi:hypothetical protein